MSSFTEITTRSETLLLRGGRTRGIECTSELKPEPNSRRKQRKIGALVAAFEEKIRPRHTETKQAENKGNVLPHSYRAWSKG